MSRTEVIFKIISIFKSTVSVINKTANQFESEHSHLYNGFSQLKTQVDLLMFKENKLSVCLVKIKIFGFSDLKLI